MTFQGGYKMGTTFKLLTATLASAMLVAGCTKSSSSGGDGGATSTAVTISGSLSSATAMSMNSLNKAQRKINVGAMSITVTDLKLYGVAMSAAGVSASSVDLTAEGAFGLTLDPAVGAMVSLLFIDKTTCTDVANPATCDSAGVVEFLDSSKTDMDGNPKRTQSVVLNGSVSLGQLSIDTDGKVIIPLSQIAAVTTTTSVSSSLAFDFTGVWTVAAYDAALPSGYQTSKTLAEQMTSQGDGGGPMIGMPITLIRLAGKAFTKDGNCSKSVCPSTAGTVGTEDAYGISIWGGGIASTTLGEGNQSMTMPSAIHACGDRLGFTSDQARFDAGLHLDAAPSITGQGATLALDFGDYVWVQKTGFGGDPSPNNQPWMKTNAAPWQQDVQSCNAKTIGNETAWVCESFIDANSNNTFDSGTDTTVYTAGLGGGCFDGNGKPVMVDNWGQTGIQGTCVDNTDGTLPAGFKSNVCTFTNQDPDGSDGITNGGSTAVVNNSAMNFTCKNAFGVFDDSALTTAHNFGNTWQPMRPKIQQVSYCREITDTLQRYRCYAHAYWSNGGDGLESWSTCAKQYRFNWSAADASSFVMTDGRNKPDAAFITDVITYSPDGLTMSVEHDEKEVRTVGGDGREVFCPVVRSTKIKATKISDTKILFDLVEDGRVEDLQNEACVAAAKTQFRDDLRGSKILFYMNKSL